MKGLQTSAIAGLCCCNLRELSAQTCSMPSCSVAAQDHCITACMLQDNQTLHLGLHKLNKSSSWEANIAMFLSIVCTRETVPAGAVHMPISTALHMMTSTCRKGKTCRNSLSHTASPTQMPQCSRNESCCCAHLHSIEDLVCFCLLDPGVVGTLPNQQGGLDLVCMIERADALIQLLVILHIPHSVNKLLLHGSPVGGDGLEQGGNMGWSHNIHTTARTLAFILDRVSVGSRRSTIHTTAEHLLLYLTGYQLALKEATSTPLQEHLLLYLPGYQLALKEATSTPLQNACLYI